MSITRAAHLELPVWILPGMADGVVALTLGYGRQRAGRVGTGVGFDTFTVRASGAPGFDSGVKLTKLRACYPLSATQNHGSMEGRPHRPRVDSVRASSGTCLEASASRGRACGGVHTCPEKRGRNPDRTRRVRGRTASLLTLEGALRTIKVTSGG